MNNRVPLPATVVRGQAFEHGMDVNLGTYGSPEWQSVRRASGFAPSFPKITSDVATNDDEGDPNEDVSGRGYNASINVQGNRDTVTGLYLPELELLLAAAIAKGDGATVDTRWYHKPAVGKPNPTRAGRVLCTVEATLGNTGLNGAEVHAFALVGKGGSVPIANPFLGNPAGTVAPSIRSVSPSGLAAGRQAQIVGSGFTGATDVKFGAVSVGAGAFTIISDSTIVAIVPAGSAGSAPVTVTTPAGTSEPKPYTRGA